MSLNAFHWSAHMLEGVPFVIKHRPIVVVDLPARLNSISYPDILLEEYDFSVEKNLIAHSAKKPSTTESEKLERIPIAPEPKISSRLPILSDQILVPIKMNSTCVSHTKNNISDNSNKYFAAGMLDAVTLKDFDKIDDPFDSVELKSINERVELETLFGADNHIPIESSPQQTDNGSAASIALPPQVLGTSFIAEACEEAPVFPRSLVALDEPIASSKVPSTVQERSISEQLCAMGFPHNRVTRALRAMGCENERALLDHLCLAQRLVETRGLEPLEAEAALHLFENDEKRALQYCKMRREFTSMGYSHEEVSEALVMSSLDRGQALRLLKQQ